MSGHEFQTYFEDSGSFDFSDTSTNITDQNVEEMRQLIARYPQSRSAILPMLHLVQSVDGRVSPAGVKIIAELLEITPAQVASVATFYTMYKRRPTGRDHIGVCVTSLCAIMGGDYVLEACEKRMGIKPGETTPDGALSLEAVECNAACDYAPVMMVNWEFMDNMTPARAIEIIDRLEAGEEVISDRGATITSWREAERVLAGFPDGRADEGPTAGGPTVLGLKIAEERGWHAPDPNNLPTPEPKAEEA